MKVLYYRVAWRSYTKLSVTSTPWTDVVKLIRSRSLGTKSPQIHQLSKHNYTKQEPMSETHFKVA